MGIPMASYKIEISYPAEPESHGGGNQTVYSVAIANANTTGKFRMASIQLIEYAETQIIPAPEEIKQELSRGSKEIGASDIQSEVREIDGIMGAVSSGTASGNKAYLAEWYPSNKLRVILSSNYPWEEGTMDLINTIHIENATQ
jgi:hypothetical protein